MTRRRSVEENDDGPSDTDIEKFGDVTRECPSCKSQVYDEAELCWKCGHAFSRADSAKPPRWVIVVTILLLCAFAYFWLRNLV